MQPKQIFTVKKNDQDSERKVIVAICLILVALVLVAIALVDHKTFIFVSGSRSGKSAAAIDEANRIVNRNLKQTYYKIESEKIKVLVANESSSPRVGQRITPNNISASLGDSGVDMQPDRNDESIARELDQSKSAEHRFKIDNKIQGELQDQQIQTEAYQAYMSEYARQFIENARQKGWDIQLDDNYVVISVRPIKKRDASMQLFNSSGEGSR
jgi:ribosomal protein S7